MIDFIIHQIQLFWKPVVEISVLSGAFYLLFVYVKDSGMAQVLKGIVFLVAFFIVAQLFEMTTVRWILSHLFQISILGFLIIFQPELRRGLARIGQSPLFKIFIKEEKMTDEIVQAVLTMSKNKIGALIAIERQVNLKPFTENAIALDALLSTELLINIFTPNTPFHDGGVVIQSDRVVAAGCLFPLSQSQILSRSMGTRHRAALGLSEETDAFVVVVSEETGTISLMNHGKILTGLNEGELRKEFLELYQMVKAKTVSSKKEEL